MHLCPRQTVGWQGIRCVQMRGNNENSAQIPAIPVDHMDGTGVQLRPVAPPNPRMDDLDVLDFHIGDAILKLMQARGYNRARLAKESRHRRNTIGALVANAAETEPKTIEDVLRVLNVDRAYVEALVNRMNGVYTKVTPIRPSDVREREIDKDPVKRECTEYGLRIATLPRDAQMAIFNVVRAFEGAITRTKSS